MKTVTIQKLSKTYLSGKEALKELSLTLSTGEVFGFLGPNGAGKTTTVKLLTGVLSPSGGSCEIMGVNPNIQPEKVHLLSGIVTEHAQMYDNLTGIENLMFYATAFGLEQKGKWRAESLLKELELRSVYIDACTGGEYPDKIFIGHQHSKWIEISKSSRFSKLDG